MTKDSIIPNTSRQAIKQVSEDLNLDVNIVESVVNAFIGKIRLAMRHEIPFSVSKFGKFYHVYVDRKKVSAKNIHWYAQDSEFFEGKVNKEITFEVAHAIRKQINGWVHDLGIPNNVGKGNVGRVVIKPEEIHKLRRVKLLEEQQKVGFNPSLLFSEDNLTDLERQTLDKLEKAPTVKEIITQLGVKVDLDK